MTTPALALAQAAPAALAECAAISTDSARLACYDRLSGRAAPPPPSSPAGPATPKTDTAAAPAANAAPADGTVAELLYAPGDQVSEGAELLKITVAAAA